MKTKTLILLFILFIGAGYLFLKPDITPDEGLNLLGNSADLVEISITPGDVVTNGDIISGEVQNAYFFEANAIGMLISANAGESVTFPITATEDWMTTEPVSFEFTLDTTGIPTGPGYIRIQNDNPSDDRSLDRYVDIPVVFQ